MKKALKIRISAILCIIILASIDLFQASLSAQTANTKACRLTVISDDEAKMECVSEGTMCSNVTACFRVFLPKT